MNRRAPLGILAFVILVLALPAMAACSKDDGETLPPPSSSTTTTARVDYSQVALPAVNPGRPVPISRPRGPGQASISGRVIDDSGAPVPQAFVRATYYLDPAKPEVVEVLAGEDGTYRFDHLLGGRWRIRAWKTPILATLEIPAFFLGATERKALDLKVKVVPDLAVTSGIAPNPPLMSSPAELAVKVMTQTVDADGRVSRTASVGAPVSLSLGGVWSLGSPKEQLTDEAGTVRFILTCGSEGSQPITAVVFGRDFPLTAPSCLDPASTTTTAPPESSSSTSTTRPRRPAAKVTTTTRPRSTSTTRSGVRPL
jgi:hypothetical protein